MAPSLDTIPADVLVQIARFNAALFPYRPPMDILSLCLTSRRMNAALNMKSSPHLYSHIFQQRFDLPLPRETQLVLTDTALTVEFERRSRCLNSIRNLDTSESVVLDVLWRCLWMLLEDSGRNEEQLAAAGFPRYMEKVFHIALNNANQDPCSFNFQCACLALWLAVLKWTPGMSNYSLSE